MWYSKFYLLVAVNYKQEALPTERPRHASCLSVVSFNGTIPRVQSFIISYFGFRFTNATIKFCSVLFGVGLPVEACCHKQDSLMRGASSRRSARQTDAAA